MSTATASRRPAPAPASASAPLPMGLQRYHLLYLAHFAAIVVLGTLYSISTGSHHANLHSTISRGSTSPPPASEGQGAGAGAAGAGSTQLPPLPTTLLPPTHVYNYWTNRKNLVNQIFVKRAWFWTTVVWALQCLVLRTRNGARIVSKSIGVDVDDKGDLRVKQNGGTKMQGQSTPTMTNPVTKSTLRWLVATAFWRELFTSWFFGPPLAERILTATGGICIPSAGVAGEVDASFCRTRSTITSKTNPDLFSKFSLASDSTTPGSAAAALKPLWRGGHDISGHMFLMVLSALYLLEEISPYLPHLLPEFIANLYPRQGWSVVNPFVMRVAPVGSRKKTEEQGERQIDIKAVAVVGGVLALVALWSWMLLMTAVYFHTPLEKVTGLLVAVACWTVLPKGG